MIPALVLALSLVAETPPPGRPLTLEEALKIAAQNQPTLRQQHATTEAANARADEAFAPNLPQVSLTASYSRATANFTAKPGSVTSGTTQIVTGGTSLNTFDYFQGGLIANQTIWDFQQTWGRYKASQSTAAAQADTENATAITVGESVRTAYFTARAQKDLVEVAQENLKDQVAHLDLTQGQVTVGTQPEIALAQAKANVANARVQLITAQNNYSAARARLNQAMGIESQSNYDIVDSALAPVPGEDGELNPLVEQAYKARPESAAYEAELQSEEFTIRSIRGAYWPSFGVSIGATIAGPEVPNLVPNLTGQLTLNWALYSGGLTHAQVQEAESNMVIIQAQRDAFHLQVRVDVEQAQLAVHAAQETLVASGEALDAAKVQLQLAEGRYQAGVGNIIELSDAQAGLTTAAAQKVQAVYTLATARAQLMAALGLN